MIANTVASRSEFGTSDPTISARTDLPFRVFHTPLRTWLLQRPTVAFERFSKEEGVMNRILSTVIVLLAVPAMAQAQSFVANTQTPPAGTGDYPRYEIGFNMGLWTLEGED